MASNSEWLARKLLELEQQVQALGRGTRLGHSSLQGESILALDEDGEVLAELGTEGGAGGVVHLDGPEPPRPTAPVLEQGVGTIFVRWDGAWDPIDEGDEGEPPTTPIDFDRIEVHATTDPEATEWDEDTLAGSITQRNGGVVMIRGWDIDDVVYVRLVCRSLADKVSEPSERAEVTVQGIDIASIVDELDAANVELANLDGTMFAANAELDALRIQFKNLDTSIINTDDGTLAEALDDARQALEAVQLATEGKNRITRSLEGPPAEYDGVENDLWWQLDSLGQGGAVVGQWRWGGTEWVSELIDSEAIAYLDAAKITAGTLEADRIATGSIGARAIAAEAVEAGKIAADSISGREIIANSIKAEHIVAFTITADELAANSVSTDKLVANSVIADKLAANSVIAEKIEALAVTADKIAANAVTADKIAANAITAGKIEAGAVTGEVLSADALNFKRAVGLELSAPSIKLGDAVEITEAHGIRQFGPDGALNVDLPSDGSPAALRGDFSARRLTAQHMQLSGDMAVAASAEVVLDPGVVAPAAAPQVSAHWPRVTLPPLTDQEQAVGIARGEGHWWRLVTTSVPFADGGRDRIEKIDLNGALVSEFTTSQRGAVGFTYLNGDLYVLVPNVIVPQGSTVIISNVVYVYGVDGTYQRQWEAGGYLFGSYGTRSPHRPGIGNDGTNVVIAQCNKDGVLNYWRRSTATGALISSHNTGDKFNADVRGLYIGSADFGGQKLLVAKQTPAGSTYRQLVVYDLPGHGYNSGLSWRTPNREAPAGLAYDGTFFWSMTSEGNLVRYSRREGTRVVGDDSGNWWLAASWRNNPAESLVGPAQRFTWPHRAELLVTVPDIPQGVTGVAFFAARQTSEPVRTDLHWVAEINEAARTVIIPSVSGTWSNDRAPVSVSSFTDQQPGKIRSMAGNFRVDGLGVGTWGPLEFHDDGTMTGLPTVAAGRVMIPAGDGTAGNPVTVTFPAGRFRSAPSVTLTADSSSPSSISATTVRNISATSMDVRLLRSGSIQTYVHWVAIDRTG